jgi:hypothetical protein
MRLLMFSPFVFRSQGVELTYLGIGKAGFDLFPRPESIQTEYFACSI